MKIHWIGVFLTLILFNQAKTQSFRGISVLNDSIAWISGNQGQVLQFDNNWINRSPQNPNYSTKDFRDIHAWNKTTAIIMSAGDSGVLLRTTDEGQHWTEVFTDYREGIFFDAIDFSTEHPELGILVGDPIGNNSHFYALMTVDSGKTWHEFNPDKWNLCDNSLSSFYAASGSSVKITSSKKVNDSAYSVELVLGGHGDSFTTLRVIQLEINNFSTSTKFNYSYPLNLPIADGVGIYSINNIHEDLLIAGGGSWKYPSNEDPLTEYSSAWFIHKNLGSKQPIKINDLEVYQYISGISAYTDMNNQINWVAGGTNGIISNNKTILKQTSKLKNVNAVQFSKNHLWIIGSQNQHIRLKLSPAE